MVDQAALDRVMEGMKTYRPDIKRGFAEWAIDTWLRTGECPMSESAQDVIMAYEKEINTDEK